jgi:bifunctional ADP-heptose synthase (sugar kinase/adenylyltransferase)
MNAARLDEIVGRFPAFSVAVVGDFFLDKYLDTDPELAEISVETGKAAHQVVAIRTSPGAAGTIVNNLASLGAGEIHAVGVTGDDGEGYDLRKALTVRRCRTDGLFALPGRLTATYLKPRNCRAAGLAGEHERYDTKDRAPIGREAEDRILGYLEGLLPRVHAVAIQDQVEEEGRGVVTASVRERLAELAGAFPERIFWADSRARIGLFRNVMIKVNAREALKLAFRVGAEEPADADVRRSVAEIRARTGRPVFVTAGARGIWTSDPEPALVRAVRLPEPTDPTGAGDSASAGAVLALCAGASPPEAALIANLVASITVQQLATTGTAGAAELGRRLEMWLSQA